MSDQPIQIGVNAPPVVVIDVSNKFTNISNADIINTLGYTPEDVANKVSDWSATPDDTHYPTEKLVKDEIDIAREEAWTNHVQENDIQNEDVLVYDASVSKFTNRHKEYLSDGGNF